MGCCSGMPLFSIVVILEHSFFRNLFCLTQSRGVAEKSAKRRTFVVGMINMNPDYEIRCQHFADLKEKYQAAKYEDSSPFSPLYFILRKADLGIELTDLESIYLQKEQLLTTWKIIQKEQQHRSKERISLGVEFTQLKSKYKVDNYNISWIKSDLYFILRKIDSGNFLNDKEFNWLLSHGLKATTSIAIEIQKFSSLKSKYKANKYQYSHLDNSLYPILKKIDISEPRFISLCLG
jgi:hypothetical protein